MLSICAGERRKGTRAAFMEDVTASWVAENKPGSEQDSTRSEWRRGEEGLKPELSY